MSPPKKTFDRDASNYTIIPEKADVGSLDFYVHQENFINLCKVQLKDQADDRILDFSGKWLPNRNPIRLILKNNEVIVSASTKTDGIAFLEL